MEVIDYFANDKNIEKVIFFWSRAKNTMKVNLAKRFRQGFNFHHLH